MAKAPVPGRVKTRLCPPLSPGEAAQYAAAALADTLHAVAACNADDKVLALEGEPGAWLPPGFRVVAQRGSSFNERLAHAWDDAGGPGVQIGMDTPQVTPDLLDGALGQVRPGRALLGPTPDGGWWALGLSRPDSRVFDGVPMSRCDTGIWQRARLMQLGYAVHDLESLVDVDHFEDAVTVAADAPCTRSAVTLDSLDAARVATTA
jgi:glycosyltransferase A (GT-A) superfamily protein (DUF2064 family)